MNTCEIEDNFGKCLFVLGYVVIIGPIRPKEDKSFGDFFFNVLTVNHVITLFFQTEASALMARARITQAVMDFKSAINTENLKGAT